jgi:hypothetical protein
MRSLRARGWKSPIDSSSEVKILGGSWCLGYFVHMMERAEIPRDGQLALPLQLTILLAFIACSIVLRSS